MALRRPSDGNQGRQTRESRGRRPRPSGKEEKKRFRPSSIMYVKAILFCLSHSRRLTYAFPTLLGLNRLALSR